MRINQSLVRLPTSLDDADDIQSDGTKSLRDARRELDGFRDDLDSIQDEADRALEDMDNAMEEINELRGNVTDAFDYDDFFSSLDDYQDALDSLDFDEFRNDIASLNASMLSGMEATSPEFIDMIETLDGLIKYVASNVSETLDHLIEFNETLRCNNSGEVCNSDDDCTSVGVCVGGRGVCLGDVDQDCTKNDDCGPDGPCTLDGDQLERTQAILTVYAEKSLPASESSEVAEVLHSIEEDLKSLGGTEEIRKDLADVDSSLDSMPIEQSINDINKLLKELTPENIGLDSVTEALDDLIAEVSVPKLLSALKYGNL